VLWPLLVGLRAASLNAAIIMKEETRATEVLANIFCNFCKNVLEFCALTFHALKTSKRKKHDFLTRIEKGALTN